MEEEEEADGDNEEEIDLPGNEVEEKKKTTSPESQLDERLQVRGITTTGLSWIHKWFVYNTSYFVLSG